MIDDYLFLNSIHSAKHNSSTNNTTINQIENIDLLLFVDVGIGDGFYGKLVKYLKPNVYMIGVEKEKSYIEKWNLKNIYNEIINDDIINVIQELKGDLIIFGDILEHLEKENATKVISTSVNNFSYILINSPVGFQEQEHEIHSEIHRCGLSKEDFINYNILNYEEFDDNRMFNCLIKGNKKKT